MNFILQTADPEPLPVRMEMVSATFGSSWEAAFIDREAHSAESTFSLSESPSILTDEIFDVYESCRLEGWDGYGALPVGMSTLKASCRFVGLFQKGMPKPEISAEPDGHLVFEWYHSPESLLSVSVSPDGLLHYAALLGPVNKQYGTEMLSDELPSFLLALIERVLEG